MRKIYECPYCQSENVSIDGYEDGGGDYGESVTPWLNCNECGHGFSEDEGFWGWEGALEELPMDDDNFSGNPDLNEISGGHDR